MTLGRSIEYRRFARFMMVGMFNTAFAYFCYAVLIYVGAHFTLASLGSLCLSILMSFVTQGRLVFGNNELARFWRFLSVWVMLYLANIALIRTFVARGADAYLAGALALPFVVIASYICQKFFVFRHTRR